jgi:polyribonucleotide nucleotidyltransferase
MAHTVSVLVGAHELKFETGRLAKIAAGACLVQYGDTMVLAAVSESALRVKQDFFPLTMDYREKMYADGSIPGGFFKREGRPTEKETLTCRLMDRPIRPLFPAGYVRDVQVQATVLSSDQENDADVHAVNAGSAALALSELPWHGPVGAVRIGRVENAWVINPTQTQRKTSKLDLIVVGTKDAITMVECSAKELPEAEMVEALEVAHGEIRRICEAQIELVAKAGRPKAAWQKPAEDEAMLARIRKEFTKTLEEAHRKPGRKLERNATHRAAIEAIVKTFVPDTESKEPAVEEKRALAKRYAEQVSQEVFREVCLSGRRYDDRNPGDIRQIDIEVGLLPRAHGSCLFQRGETQALVVATLGTKLDEQLIEGLHERYNRNFMLHYNFPNFSVNETKPLRGPGRREIGHGKLGERAVEAVLPPHADFPYTIRIVSEILESNGSSSMATVCGGTMALMDAGVKISQPVAGIAMGLIKDGDREVILTDIAGKEDAWGDMDFKVAGTQRGITALQMDIKILGVSSDLLRRSLEAAKQARISILRSMLSALRRPRAELSRFAPRLEKIQIKKDKIGALIGPGGKVIRALQEQYNTTIAVEDDGSVTLFSVDAEKLAQCKAAIEGMLGEAELGKVYEGKVVSIKEFGAFVELAPGMEGLVHVSELDDGYVANPEDVVKIGDVIKVKCVHVDPMGKVKLSRKAVIREEKGLPPEEYVPPAPRSRGFGDRGGRGGGGGRGGRDRR